MNHIKNFFVTDRFYLLAGACVMGFLIAFFIPSLLIPVRILFYMFVLLFFMDIILLFFNKNELQAHRIVSDRLSNADENPVSIAILNPYPFDVEVKLIDELPAQFQERHFSIKASIQAKEKKKLAYTLRPTERGVYNFGDLNIYLNSLIGIAVRRFVIPANKNVGVYPSFLQQKNQQLRSGITNVQGSANKRIRKIGQSMEFEQIKEYVGGDDIRTINWKATARKGALMTNHYIDEKSQQVYCVLDKGRLMKMPFEGLSLLDYAINSILSLQSVCLQKEDKVGLISFSNTMDSIIPAEKKAGQSQLIMQALYREQTDFKESDFEMLYLQLRRSVKQRSLILLYTNFETLSACKRQMTYLKSMAKFHVLVVILFKNTELEAVANADVDNLHDIYVKTIAEKYSFEKRLIVKELRNNGILTILSSPQELSANSINKYLEIKAKQIV